MLSRQTTGNSLFWQSEEPTLDIEQDSRDFAMGEWQFESAIVNSF